MYKLKLKISLFILIISHSLFAWTSGIINVNVTNAPMNVHITVGPKTIANITGFSFEGKVYSTIAAVNPQGNSLMLVLTGTIGVTMTPVDGGIHFKSVGGPYTNIGIILKDNQEHFYGITEHNIRANPDLRGLSDIEDRMNAYKREDEDAEVYTGFIYTTLGYAGFMDDYGTGMYNFGVGGATTINYKSRQLNWYFFYGPTLSQIQTHYYKIIGTPRKVPIWGCGPVVWHDNYTGSAMMLDHAMNFEKSKIPYSTMWLDRPYNSGSQGWSSMSFEGTFGNPGSWIKTLNEEYHVNLLTWIMPGVFRGTPPAGAFTGTFNQYIDLTDPAQVAWYKNKINLGQYKVRADGKVAVKGHKIDRVDNGWGVPVPPFKDGTPADERHKKYAYLNCKVTEDMVMEFGPGEDSFIFPRCAVHGCQRHTSAIWNGDTWGTWGGLLTSVGNAIRAGFLGFPMWGSDVGGYTYKGMPPIDIYCRWLSFGLYSGFMELMLDGKEPWKIPNPEHQGLIRQIFNERYRLLPYIYSIINTSASTGVTMKPLVGEYPDDPNTYAIGDQYLFGPYMLVAPLTSPVHSRNLYLPAGKWINFHNYADEQIGGKSITSPVMPLNQIPVYIKSNSIFPTGRVYKGLAIKWDTRPDSLFINAFPGAAGQSDFFTYVDYLDGKKTKKLSLSVSATNVISINVPKMTIPGHVVIRLMEPPKSVYSNVTQITAFSYDEVSKKLSVPFAANQEHVAIGVNGPPLNIKPRLKAYGKISVKHLDNGIKLYIPRMSGQRHNSASVDIVNMSGQVVYSQNIAISHLHPTIFAIDANKTGNTNFKNGVFMVRLKIGGTVALTDKFILM